MTTVEFFRYLLATMGFLTVLFSFTASVIGLKNRKHINEVKVSVDGRLDMAIADIIELKRQVEYEKTQPPKLLPQGELPPTEGN